jgi:hypothetical protein
MVVYEYRNVLTFLAFTVKILDVDNASQTSIASKEDSLIFIEEPAEYPA